MKDREARRRLDHLENMLAIESDFLDTYPEIIAETLFDLTDRVRTLEAGDARGRPLPPREADPAYGPGSIDWTGPLQNAIELERRVMFRYTKEGEKDWALRRLSPYELIEVKDGCVVRGWDHDREDIRSFRLDRIDALTTCDAYIGAEHDLSYPVLAYRKPIS